MKVVVPPKVRRPLCLVFALALYIYIYTIYAVQLFKELFGYIYMYSIYKPSALKG